jgi:hypothetical protein
MSCETMKVAPPIKQMIAELIEDSRLIRLRCFRKARKRFHVSCDSEVAVPRAVAVLFEAVAVELKREEGRFFSETIRIWLILAFFWFLRRNGYRWYDVQVRCIVTFENGATAYFGASLNGDEGLSLAKVRIGAVRESIALVIEREGGYTVA